MIDKINEKQADRLVYLINKLKLKEGWILSVSNIKTMFEMNVKQFNYWILILNEMTVANV